MEPAKEGAGSQLNWAVGILRAIESGLHDLVQATPALCSSVRWGCDSTWPTGLLTIRRDQLRHH